jgi:hypothetical protein
VYPTTPTSDDEPAIAARPCSAAGTVTSIHNAPAWARAPILGIDLDATHPLGLDED